MYEQQHFLSPIRSFSCFIHKKQKSTHICTDLQCINNPILCTICLSDPKYLNPHLNHQSSLKPIQQAIEILSNHIKTQIKPNQTLYEKTIGHKDNQLLKSNLEKMDYLTQQIENRVNNIKMQVDLEIEILMKELQRMILLEKQEFIRKIDEYKRLFLGNLDVLKKETNDVIIFQNSLKFYSNPNTLLIKLSTQAQKKSLDWFMQQKKILYRIGRNQSSHQSSYSSNNNQSNYSSNNIMLNTNGTSLIQLQTIIHKANQMNMMLKPIWNGQRNELYIQHQRQLKLWVKNNIDSWVAIPELKDLGRSMIEKDGNNILMGGGNNMNMNMMSGNNNINNNNVNNNLGNMHIVNNLNSINSLNNNLSSNNNINNFSSNNNINNLSNGLNLGSNGNLSGGSNGNLSIGSNGNLNVTGTNTNLVSQQFRITTHGGTNINNNNNNNNSINNNTNNLNNNNNNTNNNINSNNNNNNINNNYTNLSPYSNSSYLTNII